MNSIDINSTNFPVKEHSIYLNHCGVSPLYGGALQAMQRFQDLHARKGIYVFQEYPDVLDRLHMSAASLLDTNAANISFMKNTAEGLSLIAAGYPFEEGDEILSYIHEYPSNHYPWLLQKHRKVALRLLKDDPAHQSRRARSRHLVAGAWRFSDLFNMVTDRTRVIALSHVQFTSGFAADLKPLGEFCKARNIDLIIDAAQSLGSLPLSPEENNIAAIAASGWKWLLGPIGSGLLYTSPQLRQKLSITAAGADIVSQGDDYLNHSWQPWDDARRFEYSTVSVSQAVALLHCLEELFNPVGILNIREQLQQHRRHLLADLNADFFEPLEFAPENQSAINSFVLPDGLDPALFSKQAAQQGVICSSRGGYLRIAPHFYISADELSEAIGILNTVAASMTASI
ncbi:MAG: aminotransferase class V-fold PLP-dependent enzyme [Leptospiraceae bacterium]|nr:aminotransferase class V-fold PLP-dependent enzyme [Leptospiraceae bacterium]